MGNAWLVRSDADTYIASMTAYYNEWDPYAAQWLRNLIAAGLIAPGDVDERSIVDVRAGDLAGYAQCHFFAGLGGWSNALRRAGWDDDRPVWTASCPCQPFSVAGRQEGFEDERHLWPEVARLVGECGPATLFGEQVAGAAEWLCLVRSDLDAMGYAVGVMPIEAASAGADHFRDRYWFVAHRGSERRQQDAGSPSGDEAANGRAGWDRRQQDGDHQSSGDDQGYRPRPLAHGHGHGQRSQVPIGQSSDIGTERPATAGSGVRPVVNDPSFGWGEGWTESEFRSRGFTAAVASIDDRQYVECPDGKWRRLPPPGVRWLGNGIPARVDKLRALGNAIDPRSAAAFIGAFMEIAP